MAVDLIKANSGLGHGFAMMLCSMDEDSMDSRLRFQGYC